MADKSLEYRLHLIILTTQYLFNTNNKLKLLYFSPSNTLKKRIPFPFTTLKNAVTDDYELSAEGWGIGINGTVYKCRRRVTNENCALKVCILWHSMNSAEFYVGFV